MDETPASTQPTLPRRIIHLVGTDLSFSIETAAPIALRIHADTGDGVDIGTIVAGTTDDYYGFTLTALRESLANGETPVLYIEGHGENDPKDGGRHNLSLQGAPTLPAGAATTPPSPSLTAPTANTAQLLQRFVTDYERIYREQHGADARVPRLLVAVSSCYSEGILRDMSPALLNTIDLVVDDSQERPTWIPDSGILLDGLARSSTAEDFYLRQLTSRRPAPPPRASSGFSGSDTDDDDSYSLPAMATPQGVMDSDALSSRLTARNFNASKATAFENISRLSPELQPLVASTIARVSEANFDDPGNERARALVGTMANYDNRFTPLAEYQRQAPILRNIYREEATAVSIINDLRQLDSNSRSMVLGLEDTPLPEGFLDNPRQPAGGALLSAALRNDDTDGVRILLKIGADPNAIDNAQRTPLSVAAERGDIDMVRMLLDGGARVNGLDSDGRTALSYAAQRNSLEITNLLVERGADINLVGASGISPLVAATMDHRQEVKDRLLALNARVDARMDTDHDGTLSSVEVNHWLMANDSRLQAYLPATINPVFDLNGDGTGTLQEVAKVMSERGVQYSGLTSAARMQSDMEWVANELTPAPTPVAPPVVPTPSPGSGR